LLGLLLLVAPLVTSWRELGHAVVARPLLDGDVRIEVGEGARRWERRIGAIDLSVGSFTRPIGIAGRCHRVVPVRVRQEAAEARFRVGRLAAVRVLRAPARRARQPRDRASRRLPQAGATTSRP
jgi:hypothetical protein